MTSTVQGPTNPAGYQTGVPSAPVSVSSGVLATIPYPETPAMGPVPTLLTWAVILNSSPFTLLVTAGANVTQIAAFTSDLINIPPGPSIQLTVLPQPGIALVAPGSDSTVYATWYEAKPAGQYPASLGSGAVSTQVSTSILTTQPSVGPGPILVPFGPFNMTGYGSVRGTLGEVSGLGPLQYLLSWQQTGSFNAVRLIGVDAGDAVSFILPNLTDSLTVNVINQNVVTCQAVIELYKYTPALETFADPSTHGVLASGNVAGLANTAHQDIFTGPSPGPAFLSAAIAANPGGGFGWSVVASADITGNNSYAAQIYSATKISTDDQALNIKDMIMLASVPMKIRITNNTGAAQNVSWSIVTDAFRAG